MPVLRIPTPLRAYTSGQAEVNVTGANISEALTDLTNQYPTIKPHLFNDGGELRPNGMALLADGSFLLAHLGAQAGGVYHLRRDGSVAPWLLAVGGQALPPTNYVVQDGEGNTWVTVSTRLRKGLAVAVKFSVGDQLMRVNVSLASVWSR